MNVNSGGVVYIEGRQLTIETAMQINGDLQLADGRIYACTPITLSGTGVIDARTAIGLGEGEILNDTDNDVTIGGLTLTGELDLNCHMILDGNVVGDGTDTINVGGQTSDAIRLDGQGKLIADDDSEIIFWNVAFANSQSALKRLWVKSGTLRFTTWCHSLNIDWPLVIDGGGLFIVEDNTEFIVPCTLSSGTIRVAAEATMVVDPPE
ncbi:hypothetical protein RAS1_21380 [Phycisphaerae bacterium RAS1]|nr:hypothetical protein RAS1_21380 [Phycisphaerae bacterium RAS1]